MYATLALGLDGEPIPLDFICGGDGSPGSSCGLTLYYSFDQVSPDDPAWCHRYASCKNRHSWSFTFPTAQRRFIKVSEIGVPVFPPESSDSSSNDSYPRVHVGIMTDDEDEFLRSAAKLRPALAEISPDQYLVKQVAAPPRMSRRDRRTLQRQRLKEAKKNGLL